MLLKIHRLHIKMLRITLIRQVSRNGRQSSNFCTPWVAAVQLQCYGGHLIELL